MKPTTQVRVALERLTEHMGAKVCLKKRSWTITNYGQRSGGKARDPIPGTAWEALARLIIGATSKTGAGMTSAEVYDVIEFQPKWIPVSLQSHYAVEISRVVREGP